MIKPDKINEDGLPVLNWEHNEDGLPVIKKKASPVGGNLTGTLNGGGPKSDERQKVLDYMQGLKTPQQGVIRGSLVATTPKIKGVPMSMRVDEKSVEKAHNKLNEIMLSEDDRWKDPVKALQKEVLKTDIASDDFNTLNIASEIARESLAPDGYEAKKVLETTKFGSDKEDNQTANLLKDKAARYEIATNPLREINVPEDLSNASDDYLQYNYSGQIDNAAIKWYAEKNNQFGKELESSGIDVNDPDLANRIDNAKKGQIVSEFINDKDINTFLEKENPNLKPAFGSAQKNLFKNNRDYAINQISNEVSREVQKSGFNNIEPIVNFYGDQNKEYADLTAKQLYRDDPEKLEIWDNEIRNNQEKYMDAPSLFEGFASAGKDFGKGLANTFTQPFTPISKTIREKWEKEATHVSADPQGFSKFLRDSGHALGIVASIGATGSVFGGLGIPAANMTAIGIGFLGDNLEQGKIRYSNDPVKAWTSALFNTGIYMAMGQRVFPAAKVKQAFEGIKPNISNIVENLTAGKITREQARIQANGVFKQGVDLLTGAATKSVKIGAELTGATMLNKWLDKIMGADDSFHPEGEEWDTFKAMTLSNIFVGGLLKYGEMRRGNKIVEESLYEAATNPLRYQRVIESLSTKDPSINKKELLDNLNFLSQTAKQLTENGIDPKNQRRYLFEAMKDKALAGNKSGESTLAKQSSDQSKTSQEIKERILAGEDAETIVTEKEQKVIDEKEKTDTEIERLTKENELDNKELTAKRKELDGRVPDDRIKIERLEQQIKEKNEDFEKKISKLSPKDDIEIRKMGDLMMQQGKEDPTFLKEQSLDAPNGLKQQLGSDEAVIDVIAQNKPEDIKAAIKTWEGRVKDKSATLEEADNHIYLLEKGLEKATAEPPVSSVEGGEVDGVFKENGDAVTFYNGGGNLESGTGIYFTPNKELAKSFSEGSGALRESLHGKYDPSKKSTKLTEANLVTKNPKKILYEGNEITPKEIEQYKKDGYDSVISYANGEVREIVVFDKSQIVETEKQKIQKQISKNVDAPLLATSLAGALKQTIKDAGSDLIKDLEKRRTVELKEDIEFMKGREKSQIENSKRIINEKYDKEIKIVNDNIDRLINSPSVAEQSLPKGEEAKQPATKKESDEKVSNPPKEKPADEGKASEVSEAAEKGAGGKEPPKETVSEGEGDGMRLTHADTEAIYQEAGLPGRLETPTKHREQLEKEAEVKLQKGYDFDKVADKVMDGEYKFEDTDQLLFARKVADLKTKQEGLDIKSPEFDKLQNQIEKLSRASDVAGTETARALQARKNYVPVEETISDYVSRDREAAGVEVLTDKQKETAQKEYEDISKAKREFDEYMAKKEADFTQKMATAAFEKQKSTTKKSQKKDFKKEREEIFTSIKEKLRAARGDTSATLVPYAKELFAIAPDVAKLVKSYVEQGVVEFSEVVKRIHADLKEDIKGIEEKDIRDLIAGVYNKKGKTRNELAARMMDIKIEAKLTKQLEDLLNGEIPKSEKRKQIENKKIEDLKKQIKDIKSIDKEARDIKETLLEAATQRQKEIGKDLTKAEKEIYDKERKEKKASELESAKLGKEIKYRTPEERALAAQKTKMTNEITEIQQQLKSGDFSKETPKPPVKLDESGLKLRDNLIKLRQARELRLLLQQRQNEGRRERGLRLVAEVANIPRTLMTILDFSALLRQNLFFSVGHPLMTAKAVPGMFKSFTSQEVYDRWFADYKDSPRYEMKKESRLAIADSLSHDLTKREEAFMSTLAEKIPLIGQSLKVDGKTIIPGANVVKGSERSYTMLLNKMRSDMFDIFAYSMENRGLTMQNSPKAYKAMAEYINNATGRSDFGETLNRVAPVLNSVFFSPRLIASRVNMLTYWAQPRFWKSVPREVRVDYFRNWISLLAVGGTILTLAQLAGADVEDDPRSSDFGKIKSGNTRWDIWGGAQPYVRVLAQVVSGERKSTKSGKIYSLSGDDIFGEDRAGVVADFFRNKLAPVPGAAVDLLSGRTGIGDKIVYEWSTDKEKEISIRRYIQDRIMPMTFSGTAEAMKDQGVKALFTVGIPNVFGVGTQTYENKKTKDTSKKESGKKEGKKQSGKKSGKND